MALTWKHIVATLVFCTLQVNIRAQDDKARADEAKAYADSVQSLLKLGKSLDAVAAKLYTTQLGFQDIINSAANLAKQSILAVERALNIITLAANQIAQKSPSCANTKTERTSNILIKVKEDIEIALSTLNELIPIGNQLNTIKLRIENNTLSKNYLLLKCKENVTVTATTVDAITNCYKQVVKEFEVYIVREGNNVNAQYAIIDSASQNVNLLSVFGRIVMDADSKAKSEAQTILLLCVTNTVIDVAEEINKIENDNRNTINTKINRIMDFLSVIDTNVAKADNVTVDVYVGLLFSVLSNTLNLFPNNTVLPFDRLLLSDTKKDALKNIQAAISNVLNKKPTGLIADQTFALINDLQDKISVDYVKNKCQKFVDVENYNKCANETLNGLRSLLNDAINNFDGLYNQAVKLKLEIVNAVNSALKLSLDKVYNSSINRIVDAYVGALGSSVSTINIELGNKYNEEIKKLNSLKPTVRNLIDSTFDNIMAAVAAVKSLNVSIDLDVVLPKLESLLRDTLNAVDAATDKGFDFKLPSPIILDISLLESSLKNCTSKQNSIDQALRNCIDPIVSQLNNNLYLDNKNLQNSTESLVNFVSKLETNLDQLVQKAYNIAYETIKNASTDPNTPALVQTLEKEVLIKGDSIKNTLDNIRTELNSVNQQTLNSITSVPQQIDNAVASLDLALDIVFAVNPKANLTQEKALLDKLKNDAITVTNSSISGILRQANDYLANVTKLYSSLIEEYKNIVSQLNENTLASKCKNESGNETAFISCVAKIIKDYNKNVSEVSNKINNLYSNVKNLTLLINATISAKVKEDLKTFTNQSDIAAAKIFSDNNITNQQVVYDALLNIKQYNISNILKTINQVTLFAEEIDRRTSATISTANYTLITSGGAINDIVGTGKRFCSANSVDKIVKDTADMISSASKAALSTAPDMSAVSSSLLLIAKFINNTLNYQLGLLKESKLNETCPPELAKNGTLYVLHRCILIQINKFGYYYNAETNLLLTYEQNGYEKLIKSLEELTKWYNEVVVPKSKEISNTSKQNAQNYYKNCNITAEKILSYALDVSKNHYNNFQSRISTIVNEINSLATKVASKEYRPSSSVLPRLQAVVAPVDAAVAAVLSSNKSSIITDEIKRAAQNLIDDGVRSMSSFLASFPYQSVMARRDAAKLLQDREDAHKNHNETSLMSRCYNQSAQFPLVDFSACLFSLTYRNIYVGANVNTLNSLTVTKQNLDNLDANWQALIAAQADLLVSEQSKSAYYLANRIYKAAGLTVPKEVAAAVDTNRCLQGISLPTSEFICVIVI